MEGVVYQAKNLLGFSAFGLDKNYMNNIFTRCWAHLGRQGGTQAVNLGEQGCFTSKTVNVLENIQLNIFQVTHELLHTLGVIHEHTRPDRSADITAILPGYLSILTYLPILTIQLSNN